MITLYLGIKDNTGKVNDFHELPIPHTKRLVTTDYITVNGTDIVNTVRWEDDGSYDDIPVFTQILKNVFSDNILANHINEDIYVFSDRNEDSELNFRFKIFSIVGEQIKVAMYDPIRNIGRIFRSDRNPCFLAFNAKYPGDTLEEIMENVKVFSAGDWNTFDNKTHASLELGNNVVLDLYNLYQGYWGSYYNNYADMKRRNVNVNTWQNWYTLIFGRQPYTGFELELEEPVNGISKIEFSIPLDPMNGLDTGKNYDITYGDIYGESKGRDFEYVMVGTDLMKLFRTPGNTSESVLLRDGYKINKYAGGSNEIRLSFTKDNTNFGFVFSFAATNNFDCFIERYDNYILGNYLLVNPEYVSEDVENWKDKIDNAIGQFEFDTTPFAFISSAKQIPDSGIGYSSNYNTVIPDSRYLHSIYSSRQYMMYCRGLTPNTLDKQFLVDFVEGITRPKPIAPPEPNIGKNYISKAGGGNGNYDEYSDNIPHSVPGSNLQMSNRYVGTYEIDDENLENLSKWIAGKGEFGTNLEYAPGIISIKKMCLPIEPNVRAKQLLSIYGRKTIAAVSGGNAAEGYPITQNLYSVTFGTFKIEEFYGNFLDYTQTKISIYLPFAGLIPLETTEVMNSTLTVYLNYDIISGTGIWSIRTNKDNKEKEIFSKECKLSMEIPLTAESNSRLATTVMGGIGATIAAGVAGGTKFGFPGAVVGAVVGASAYAFGNRSTPTHEGVLASNFGDVTGFLSNKIPFLIITRPKMSIPENYGALYGYPSNITARIGDLQGFTKIKDVHMEGFSNSTKSEIESIERILKEGFII